MSAIVCTVLLALLGALTDAGSIRDTSETEPVYASCLIDDQVYQDGELTPDDCDRCRCRNGLNICTRNLCPHGTSETEPLYESCLIDDQVYQHGELTPDDCDRCRCRNGLNICTRNLCPHDGTAIPVPE